MRFTEFDRELDIQSLKNMVEFYKVELIGISQGKPVKVNLSLKLQKLGLVKRHKKISLTPLGQQLLSELNKGEVVK